MWQTIDSAPKDGTVILLYGPSKTINGELFPERVTCGNWLEWADLNSEYHATTGEYLGQYATGDHGEGWESWDGGFQEDSPPTHWQPLPDAPEHDAMEKVK